MSKLTDYGFTMGDGVLNVSRACESRPGERRWACVDIDAGATKLTIQCSGRRCYIRVLNKGHVQVNAFRPAKKRGKRP